MTDAELLSKVKSGMLVQGSHLDVAISQRLLAVKQYVGNAGVTTEQIESDLGVAVLTLGVTDLMTLSGGEVKFSDAFDIIMTQLKAVSMPDV
jgi:hypothetical protein